MYRPMDDLTTTGADPEAPLIAADGGIAGDPAVTESTGRLHPLFEHWIFGGDWLWGCVGIGLSAAMVFWYFWHFGHATSDIHRGYGDSAFDIGLYDQGVWLLSRFHAPYVTLMGRNLFGDHTQFSLLVLVPLYWVRPDATTLLYTQALVMALGAVPVYMLAMRRLRNPAFATVFVAAFLLHPALARSNLENYHPDSFLIPIIGLAIYAAIENKPRMFLICSALALMCKEDVVLILLPIALWYAIRHNRRVGAFVVAASIAFAAFATNVIMRSLIGVPTLNTWRIPFGGVHGFLMEALRQPADVVKYLIKGEHPNGRPFYVWQMIAPTGLLFFVAPEVAVTVVAVLAINVMSTFGYQHQIAYHYSMVLLPGLALGTVYAVARLRSLPLRVIAVAVVGLSALWSAYLWGPYPFSFHSEIPHWSPAYSAVHDIDQVRKQLPAHAVVSTYYTFAPHVDHRRRVYMWPTPFSASYWGTFKQEGKRLPFADDVQYLLLPANLQDHKEVFDSIKSQFVEIARSENEFHEGAALYKRIRP
jgi:uncharacterized membrane protein